MNNIPNIGPKIPIIGAKGMETTETATAQEAATAIMIQQAILRMLDQTKVPRGVQVNAVIGTLAMMAAVATLHRDRSEEELQATVSEMFRRIFDAAASVEDLVHRGVPWKAQSLKVKDAERGGGGVELVARGERDGKPS